MRIHYYVLLIRAHHVPSSKYQALLVQIKFVLLLGTFGMILLLQGTVRLCGRLSTSSRQRGRAARPRAVPVADGRTAAVADASVPRTPPLVRVGAVTR